MDIPSILVLGVLDGFNICNISLLTLYLSLLYGTKVHRHTVLLLGIIYIAGVFTSYFLIGFGILIFSINLPLVPHFLSRVAAAIMIFVGVVNIVNYAEPGLISLSFTHALGVRVITLMKGGGAASTALAGLLVGVHNFPCACTGGIYPMVIALIADLPLRILYLIVYNMMFVTPMGTILYICSSESVTLRVRRWQHENRLRTLLVMGIVMVTSGFIILLAISLGAS